MMHVQRVRKVVEGVSRAGFARHHVGISNNERTITAKFGYQTAQPRSSMSEILAVMDHVVTSVGQELDHRFVRTVVVAQPNVGLSDVFEPLQQLHERRQSVAHNDDYWVLLLHFDTSLITEKSG